MKLFSKRNTPPPETLSYELEERVRSRILVAFQKSVRGPGSRDDAWDSMLAAIEQRCMEEYGAMRRLPNRLHRPDHPVIEHFFACDSEMAIDFIEMCF